MQAAPRRGSGCGLGATAAGPPAGAAPARYRPGNRQPAARHRCAAPSPRLDDVAGVAGCAARRTCPVADRADLSAARRSAYADQRDRINLQGSTRRMRSPGSHSTAAAWLHRLTIGELQRARRARASRGAGSWCAMASRVPDLVVVRGRGGPPGAAMLVSGRRRSVLHRTDLPPRDADAAILSASPVPFDVAAPSPAALPRVRRTRARDRRAHAATAPSGATTVATCARWNAALESAIRSCGAYGAVVAAEPGPGAARDPRDGAQPRRRARQPSFFWSG